MSEVLLIASVVCFLVAIGFLVVAFIAFLSEF